MSIAYNVSNFYELVSKTGNLYFYQVFYILHSLLQNFHKRRHNKYLTLFVESIGLVCLQM